ncbi:MAG: Putative peptidase [Clostridiales bacterium 38_11]|nr:MAG: Putative peptidase [Clostridiales bacterium 38_11]HBH13574.1 peptidase dimerization protein [Clostridiales bacterium]
MFWPLINEGTDLDLKRQIDDIEKYVDNNRDKMVQMWKEFVSIETGSNDKAGIDQLADRIKEILDYEGFTTEVRCFDNSGNSIFATKKGASHKKPICLIGHMDTVFSKGTLEKNPFRIEEGKVFGPGVLDMKGGIVAAIFALRALNTIGYNEREIKVVFSGDEEVGHKYSETHDDIMEFSRGSEAAFNMETGAMNGGFLTGRKGSVVFKIESYGKAVHSGIDHKNGISAILEIAHKTIEIEKLTNYKKGITFNVGVIQGGERSNIRPDYATIEVDCRFTKLDHLEGIISAVKEINEKSYINGTKSTFTHRLGFYPMEETDGSIKLINTVADTCRMLGLKEPRANYSGGSSDSSNSVRAGVPTLCGFGVKGEFNHTLEEYALLESLFERSKLLATTITIL